MAKAKKPPAKKAKAAKKPAPKKPKAAPKKRKPVAKKTAAKAKPKSKKKPVGAPLRGGGRIPPERLHLVEKGMAACKLKRDIVIEVMETYKVTEKTAYNYYDKVEREWQDEAKPKRRHRRAVAIKRLENAYRLAMEVKAPSAAVRAVDSIAKIDNLYEPDEIILTDIRHPTEHMTSAQRRAYIDEKRKARDKLLALIVKEEPTAKQIH